jgi:hypothetical protein
VREDDAVSFPNTAPITTAEKLWALLLAPLSVAIGLIVLIGLVVNQRWARWLGLVVAGMSGVAWAVVAVLLLVNRDAPAAQNYPFYPWFIFLAALFGVLCLLAARAFGRGLRSAETEA